LKKVLKTAKMQNQKTGKLKMEIEKIKNSFSKFKNKNFRNNQKEIIEEIIKNKKKVIFLKADTGFGKSLVAACLSRYYNNSLIVVHSKALQHQLRNDFPEIPLLKGRSNYPCGARKGKTANECMLINSNECNYACPYNIQKRRVAISPMGILNYNYYLLESNYVGMFSGRKFIVCDEADLFIDILENFVSLTISENMVRNLSISMPKYKTTRSDKSIDDWHNWAMTTLKIVEDKIEDIKSDIEFINNNDIDSLKKELENLTSLKNKLTIFINNVNKTWLYEVIEHNMSKYHKFSPTWLTRSLVEQFFLKHVTDKVVFMSATFHPVEIISQLTGLTLDEIGYYEISSDFPKTNRPIYLNAVGDLSYNSFEVDVHKIITEINNIMNKYPNDKGLIHCTNYKLRDRIIQDKRYIDSNNRNRFITHNTSDRNEKLRKFKANKTDNKVLISPSMERGIDLPDKLCRFIIVAKAPFLNVKDKKVSARIYSRKGFKWYISEASLTLEQMCGRGNRHKNDICDIYILDDAAKRLILDNWNNFGNHFKKCLVR